MSWLGDNEIIALGLLSPIVGSFIAAAADRIPLRRTISWTRSNCDSCKTTIPARDLIPILSYLRLRGRCRNCGAEIPIKLLVAEAGIVVVTLCAIAFLRQEQWFIGILLAWILFALAWFDFQQWRLPNALTLPLLAAGLGLAAINPHANFIDHLLGAVAGYTIFLIVAFAYNRLRNREALGGGDIKLIAAAGAWLGWQYLTYVVLFASVVALAVALLRGRNRTDAIQFGPYLAGAFWVVWARTAV